MHGFDPPAQLVPCNTGIPSLENSPHLSPPDLEMLVPSVSIRASVIIVGYNSRIDLERCLPGLLASAASDVEIIVVDNASQDGSAGEIQAKFPEVHLIISQRNQGYGGANNLGARQARGRSLVFLNPDTIVQPGWLEPLVAALEAGSPANLVTSKVLLMDDPRRINTCGNNVHISGLTLCRGMGRPVHEFDRSVEVSAVSGAAFAMPRTLFDALGGFDERFFMYMEDTDLSMRARLAGCACLYVPSSVVVHNYRLTFGPLKTYYQERNRYCMLLKCLRWRTLLVLLPILLLAEVVTCGFVLARDRHHWRNKLRAYAWVIKGWDEIMRERGKVQSMRRVPDRALLRMTGYGLGLEQTGEGRLTRVAQRIINPLFRILYRWVLALIPGE